VTHAKTHPVLHAVSLALSLSFSFFSLVCSPDLPPDCRAACRLALWLLSLLSSLDQAIDLRAARVSGWVGGWVLTRTRRGEESNARANACRPCMSLNRMLREREKENKTGIHQTDEMSPGPGLQGVRSPDLTSCSHSQHTHSLTHSLTHFLLVGAEGESCLSLLVTGWLAVWQAGWRERAAPKHEGTRRREDRQAVRYTRREGGWMKRGQDRTEQIVVALFLFPDFTSCPCTNEERRKERTNERKNEKKSEETKKMGSEEKRRDQIGRSIRVPSRSLPPSLCTLTDSAHAAFPSERTDKQSCPPPSFLFSALFAACPLSRQDGQTKGYRHPQLPCQEERAGEQNRKALSVLPSPVNRLYCLRTTRKLVSQSVSHRPPLTEASRAACCQKEAGKEGRTAQTMDDRSSEGVEGVSECGRRDDGWMG